MLSDENHPLFDATRQLPNKISRNPPYFLHTLQKILYRQIVGTRFSISKDIDRLLLKDPPSLLCRHYGTCL